MPNSLRIYIALFITTLFWSSAFVGIRFTLREFSPGPLALLRFMVASSCMGIIYYLLSDKKAVERCDKVALMALGILGIGLYNFFLNLGEVNVSASIASFIIGLLPLVAILFAIGFLKEVVGKKTWAGVFIAIMGLMLLGLSNTENCRLIGEGYVFIATVLGAIYTVTQKQFLLRHHPIQVTCYIIWGGTLSLLVFLPGLIDELPKASWMGIVAVVYMGIFPAALAYLAWSYVIHQMPASRAVVFLYLLPFFSTAMGFIFLKEVPMFITLLGGGLGMLGAYIASQDKKAH